MTNTEYYGILGLIRKEQSDNAFYKRLALQLMIFLGLFPAFIILAEVILYDDLAVEKVLVMILVGGVATALVALGVSFLQFGSSTVGLVKLLNESRHLPAEEVEKMKEFKDLFQ